MESNKQKDQQSGYVRDTIIRTILGHYKTKLEDLSMEELEEELYAEEATTKFGEIPYQRPSNVDERMVSKWMRHENYSKKVSRETLRPEPRHQSEK